MRGQTNIGKLIKGGNALFRSVKQVKKGHELKTQFFCASTTVSRHYPEITE